MNELPPTAGLPLEWQDFSAALFAGNDDAGFSTSLAKFIDVPELDIFSSGTLCLSIAFETLKRKTGRSKVIVPAYTCPLVAIAARAAGVDVLLCDTQFGSTEMSLEVLKELCDETVAAVVPTDIAGLPCDIQSILPIAKAAGAYVVQDSAQSLGARLDGKSVGAYADIVIFSLAVGKGLSLYDGGIIATRDDELRREIRQIAKTRVFKKPAMNLLRAVELFGLMLLYNPSTLPLVYGNARRKALDEGDLIKAVGEDFDFEIPAYEFGLFRQRIGARAFKRLPSFIDAARSRALKHKKSIEAELGLQVLSEREGAIGNWPFLMLMAETEEQRDEIMNRLWRSNYGVTRLFINELSGYSYLNDCISRKPCPNAQDFAARSFSISNTHWMEDAQFTMILQALKSVVKPKQSSLV